MILKEIDILELKEYIIYTFNGDEELIKVYDKNYKIKNIKDICDSVYEKILSLNTSPSIRGILSNDLVPIGYFVFEPFALISFGMNILYRDKENLNKYWEYIKKEINTVFQCYLFDYNIRAINWLKKCGMNILFENVTILELCH